MIRIAKSKVSTGFKVGDEVRFAHLLGTYVILKVEDLVIHISPRD